ncbi:MAG: GxxExxY protein [Chitinophagaceae bacterium]|nr:GxxExxY protein [Chitinophagaceae bacterium]
MHNDQFPLKDETYQIIGACMEVQKTLGYGFAEVIYKDAIEVEFEKDRIPFLRETQLWIQYKGIKLKHQFFADFTCFNQIIIEVKASPEGIISEHIAQLLNYLKVSGNTVGLLINFGKRKLEYQRFILTSD